MKSVSAVYARLDRAARSVVDGALSAWMGRRTGNAVQEAIRHGLSMANDPDYRLGVEADRFAQEYADAIDGFNGMGREGAKRRALISEAQRLRMGRDTDTGRAASRREVERLLAEMRAEIDALRAPAPREYRYGAQNRPPGYGSAPTGILRVDPPVHNIGQTRHGVVVYARPLTDEEVRGYELAPYVPLADIVARLRARVDRYGAQYADRLRKGDTATLQSGLQGAIEEPFFTDVPHGDLWGFVADALLAKYPAAPVAPVPVKAPTLPGGFDSFDDDEAEPAATWQDTARMALTAKMGEGEVTPVSSFLRDGETLAGVEPLAYRFDTRVSVHELDRVVLLFAPSAGSEATAEKIVATFRRKLVPRTKATNAAWFAHLARIVVAGPAGSWNFDAEPDPARAPRLRGEGDTVTAQKERLIVEAQQAFGRGVMISGNTEKGYTLHISPTTKKHKWAAASLRFGHDFDNAHRQLAEAIRRVSEASARVPASNPARVEYEPDAEASAEGEWDRTGPEPVWRQAHDALVVDALHSWKGDPADMTIHIADERVGAAQPRNGSGKQKRAQAAALIYEMQHNSTPARRPLYRGSHIEPRGEQSWTTSRKIAAFWAGKNNGRVFELPAGTRGLRIEDYFPDIMNEKEWLVHS